MHSEIVDVLERLQVLLRPLYQLSPLSNTALPSCRDAHHTWARAPALLRFRRKVIVPHIIGPADLAEGKIDHVGQPAFFFRGRHVHSLAVFGQPSFWPFQLRAEHISE